MIQKSIGGKNCICKKKINMKFYDNAVKSAKTESLGPGKNSNLSTFRLVIAQYSFRRVLKIFSFKVKFLYRQVSFSQVSCEVGSMVAMSGMLFFDGVWISSFVIRCVNKIFQKYNLGCSTHIICKKQPPQHKTGNTELYQIRNIVNPKSEYTSG